MEITGDLKQNGESTPNNPANIENKIYLLKNGEKIKLERTDMIRLFEQELKIAIEKEKTADQMFEELGYIKFDNHPEEDEENINPNMWVTQDCRIIEYKQEATIKGMFYVLFIRFHIVGKRVEIGASERPETSKEMARYRSPILSKQELQAINKKVEELRMELMIVNGLLILIAICGLFAFTIIIIVILKYLILFIKECFKESIFLGLFVLACSIAGISLFILYLIASFIGSRGG